MIAGVAVAGHQISSLPPEFGRQVSIEIKQQINEYKKSGWSDLCFLLDVMDRSETNGIKMPESLGLSFLVLIAAGKEDSPIWKSRELAHDVGLNLVSAFGGWFLSK